MSLILVAMMGKVFCNGIKGIVIGDVENSDLVDVRRAFEESWRNLTLAEVNLKEDTEVVDGITEHINNAEDMHNKVSDISVISADQ